MNKKTVSIAAYNALKEQGMKKGSYVKILSTWPARSEGFDAEWTSEMDLTVGKVGRVISIHELQHEVRVNIAIPGEDHWWYPTMILSLVDPPADEMTVNESISLSDFNDVARTVAVKVSGATTVKRLSYDEIDALYRVINPNPISIAGYDVKVNREKKTVSIGCQTISFADVKKVCRKIGKVRDFEVGDTVEYYRQPTAAEWDKIGEVKIPYKIGEKLVIRGISENTGSLCFDGCIFCFPKEAFRHA